MKEQDFNRRLNKQIHELENGVPPVHSDTLILLSEAQKEIANYKEIQIVLDEICRDDRFTESPIWESGNNADRLLYLSLRYDNLVKSMTLRSTDTSITNN